MISFEQLSKKGKDPIGTFERLFRAALESLLPDLAASPWYVREREVVNLFIFRHLLPRFQMEKLDISQIGIEVPVLKRSNANCDQTEEVRISESDSEPSVGKSGKAPREAVGKYADIVVWPHSRATRWRTCRPLAHIEWKNISCLKKDGRELVRQHERDICLLKHSRDLVWMSYAVLTDQRDQHVELRCTRIANTNQTEDFLAPSSRVLPAGIVLCERVLANQSRVWCLKYDQKESTNMLTYNQLKMAKQGSACPNEGCNPEWLAQIKKPSDLTSRQ